MSNYLSKHGYVIRKENYQKSELSKLKVELRARPLTDDKFTKNGDSSYPIYIETKNKLYIPKMFGINKFGFPDTVLENYEGKEWEEEHEFTGALLDRQIEPVNALLDACHTKGGGILSAGTGVGKCMKIDTPILMFDGSVKMVQDITVGELLMGDDSKSRNVLSLARGQDLMYEIIPVKGESYTVNQEHILCLKASSYPHLSYSNKRKYFTIEWLENNEFCNKYIGYNENNKNEKEKEANNLLKSIKCEQILEITVKDYIKLSKYKKRKLKGYKVPINFPEKQLDFDPYIIGFWLGGSEITIKYFKENLQQYNCYLQYINNKSSESKHIPLEYKCNSRENRLRLLAGLLDSHCSLTKNKYTLDFIQKSEKLIDDIIYLARSLGFACYKSKECLGEYKEDDYFRIYISGNTEEIPTLYQRKKTNVRKQIKDVLVTGIMVKEVGYDNYYGFTLDGNRRYVMGDFTVTHNTVMGLYVLSKLKAKTIIIVNKIPLMHQWKAEIQQFFPSVKVGILQGQKNVDTECDIVIGMLQSLARIDYPDELFKDFKCLIFDEAHNSPSLHFSKVLFKLCCKYTIGLSATPNRADGCEYVFKWHLGDIVYETKVTRKGLPPIIKLLKIDTNEYKEVSILNKFTGQKQIQFTSMLSELVEMPKRNTLIIELIKDLIKNDTGRKILVLSDRRTHLLNIKDLLDKDLNITFTYGLFLGAMKQKELDKGRSCQIILATFAAFKEGVSEKELNCLILTSPKKYIGHLGNKTIKKESGGMEQIVGRIFRKDHIERNPVIIDLQDNFSVYKSQGNSRKIFYKEHFTNAIYEDLSINLDENENVSVSFIKSKKKSKKQEVEETEKNNNLNSIMKYCILDDD